MSAERPAATKREVPLTDVLRAYINSYSMPLQGPISGAMFWITREQALEALAKIEAKAMSAAKRQELTMPLAEVQRLRRIEEKAKDVIDLYPTIAGTAILIRDANSYVPRNPWDNVADAVYNLSRAVQS